MQAGYLSVETHEAHPGIVRLVVSSTSPEPAVARCGDCRLRYVARFEDREAALMHAHNLLRRRLFDADAHLYRVPLERAIATIESIDLPHRRLYLDPDFGDAMRGHVATLTDDLCAQRRAREHVFDTIGYCAIALLIFNLLVLSLP